MATSSCNVITDWKRLWQLVSGIHHETPENTVLEELLNVSKELQDGLLQFKETKSSNTDLECLLREKKQEKLLSFTQRLQELLDLESKQCWEILCYYLANEYRGSASSLTTFISTEGNMTKLLDDIWGYYTLERMIVLKIVKNLLVFYKVPNHPYHREYKQIVEKITLSKLRDSYIKQLEHLINEVPPSKLSAGEFFNYQAKLVTWSERNIREITEVLHILLLILEYLPVEVDQLKRLFNCFKYHSFGKQQRYLNPNLSFHAELMKRTAFSEIVLFIKCIDFENPHSSSALAEEIIRTLDKDISQMYHNQENGPILFAWMLLNLRCTNIIEDEDSLLKYRQFGKRALDLNCFQYLKTLVANPMFKDDSLVSRIARKTIYNQLTYMCDLFDADGSCSKHPFIYELLCELLSWSTIAKEFCSHEEGGVRSLYTTLLETFPIDFVHVSMIANALNKGGMGEYIYSQLVAMPILTDLYDENKFSLESAGDDEYVLSYDYKPFRGIDFIVPAGTTAAVMERAEGFCVHFRSDVNYFNVLHNEINRLLDEAIQQHSDFQSSERLKRVHAGLKYLESALQRTKTLSAITVEMVHPTEMCIDIINKFKTVQNPPVQLMSTCLNVCTALLPLVDTEIFTRVINLNIFPVITTDAVDDYKKYALGFCFDSRLVGTYLVDVEKKLECYDFLLAYLSFLRAYTKMQKNSLFQVEIPGLIFLLREVFPHMHTWRFRNPDEKNKIYAEIMGFICDILDAVTFVASKDKKNKIKRLLRDICVYSLLNSDNGFVLLKFVAVGNAYLQHTMELESNWMQQQTHGLMLLVRLSMRILMQLLRLKTTIYESTELSPLEALICTQPKQRDTLRIIPVVTSYMSNIFDRWLPILSCRLLKRIALEFNMSLLACLDMEPDQIRLTFLQKLPDELESDSLKIAVLELVEACIEKQPGVTEAFFKVDFASEKRLFGKDKEAQIADSILTFMEDYLEAVEKEPNTVQNTLPRRIMNIFHSLWKHNMQILVEELSKKPKFWQQLCTPLFSEFSPNVRAYTQLLNIMGIEIFCTPNKPHTELKKEITKLFDPLYLEKWLNCVFDMPKMPSVLPLAHEFISDDTPEWLCRLQAFKDFLIIILNKQPHVIEIPQKQSKLLAQRCLTVLVERSLYVADLRPFIILSEMYLFILLNFKHAYTESEKEDREMLKQLIQLLDRVASCYEDLHVRAKEACLSITIKCSDLLAGELLKDSSVALSFLHSVVSIICMELQNLENCVKAEVHAKTTAESSSSSLILSLNLLKTIAVIFHNDGPGNWDLPFIANKLFQRLLSCTGTILQMYSKQKLSVELLDVLIVFAKGNCSAEFLYCDVSDYLWLKMLPPKELLQVSYNLGQQRTDGWTVQKWWPIYTRGIELITILLQKHKHQFLKDILQFVGIHEEYLMDSLLLGKQSLEPLAMELIKCAVSLIASVVIYEKQWRLDHAQSLFNLMRCVQMLMGHSISMFHQPKNLKSLISGRRSQLDILREVNGGGLVDEVITALNDLTEILIICVKCLQPFSPGILELICEPEFLTSKWEPIFEIHFGAPKLNENAMTLTFGTVLSVVGVYTKALSLQNYVFHDTPLNILPVPVEADSNNTANRSATTATSTAPRPFSKSLSVTSVSSANCPSNELLSNLDGELCLMALEHVLFLAASQSMLALKNTQLPPREKQLIRREISTELITYHEFLRKKVLNDFREHKEIWHRRKHGQVLMKRPASDQNGDNDGPSTSSAAASRSVYDKNRRISSDLRSMRVNVVRRLHLQQQQRPPAIDSFEITNVISPSAISSTPHLVRPPIRRQGEQMTQADGTKRCHTSNDLMDEDDDYEVDGEEIEYFPPENPKYSPLSYVQLVEEDYLHFMSNLFTVICQSD